MPAEAKKAPVSEAAGELGRRVREARLDLSITQEMLAERSGLHWSYIGQVERGRNNPTFNNILLLAQSLEVDAGSLIAGLQPPLEVTTKVRTATPKPRSRRSSPKAL